MLLIELRMVIIRPIWMMSMVEMIRDSESESKLENQNTKDQDNSRLLSTRHLYYLCLVSGSPVRGLDTKEALVVHQ